MTFSVVKMVKSPPFELLKGHLEEAGICVFLMGNSIGKMVNIPYIECLGIFEFVSSRRDLVWLFFLCVTIYEGLLLYTEGTRSAKIGITFSEMAECVNHRKPIRNRVVHWEILGHTFKLSLCFKF